MRLRNLKIQMEKHPATPGYFDGLMLELCRLGVDEDRIKQIYLYIRGGRTTSEIRRKIWPAFLRCTRKVFFESAIREVFADFMQVLENYKNYIGLRDTARSTAAAGGQSFLPPHNSSSPAFIPPQRWPVSSNWYDDFDEETKSLTPGQREFLRNQRRPHPPQRPQSERARSPHYGNVPTPPHVGTPVAAAGSPPGTMPPVPLTPHAAAGDTAVTTPGPYSLQPPAISAAAAAAAEAYSGRYSPPPLWTSSSDGSSSEEEDGSGDGTPGIPAAVPVHQPITPPPAIGLPAPPSGVVAVGRDRSMHPSRQRRAGYNKRQMPDWAEEGVDYECLIVDHPKKRPDSPGGERCGTCGRGCGLASDLRNHQECMTGGPEKCPICKHRCRDVHALSLHLYFSHGKQMKWRCRHCGLTLRRPSILIRHMLDMSFGEFECRKSTCPHKFVDSQARGKHYRATGH